MYSVYFFILGFFALIVFGLFGSLALIEKRGLKVHCEFQHCFPVFTVDATKPTGVTRKDVESIVASAVAQAIDTHLSAMETYKDNYNCYDTNARTLIAHKLDDITIPKMDSLSHTQMQILSLTVKLELLILNAENHYLQSSISKETLSSYLQGRYARLLNIVNRFSSDAKECRRVAYVILRNWWATVVPVLQSAVEQKKTITESAQSILVSEAWQERMIAAQTELAAVNDVLTNHSDVRGIIRDYFESTLVIDVPVYLLPKEEVSDV